MPKLIIRGKQKRGDRGSTEEELKTSKRANMADVLNGSEGNPTLDDEDLETADEPTREELKEMLVDIQISIQSILRENKETRREVVQLQETVLEQKTTIASLKSTVAGLEKMEMGPHKDREKLWPGWELNPRPSGQISAAPPTEPQGQTGAGRGNWRC